MFDDNDQFELSRYKWVLPFAAVIIVISLFLVRCSTDNLRGYQENSSSSSENSENSSSSKEPIVFEGDTSTYYNSELNYSLDIPTSWSKIAGAGQNVSFVDRQTGTTLEIKVSPYEPQINMIDRYYLEQQAGSRGMEIREFNKETNSEYAVTYASSKYGYIDHVYWDRSNIISLGFTLNAEKYNDAELNKTVIYILNSFKWASSDPIAEGLSMKYYSYGNFEFGSPEGWDYGESRNTILVTSPDGSAAITLSVNEAASTLQGISQVDLVNYLSQSKPGFMLKSFDNNGAMISCTGTYPLNNKTINLQQYFLVNNSYEYTFTFESESEKTSELAVTIQNVINSFRCF